MPSSGSSRSLPLVPLVSLGREECRRLSRPSHQGRLFNPLYFSTSIVGYSDQLHFVPSVINEGTSSGRRIRITSNEGSSRISPSNTGLLFQNVCRKKSVRVLETHNRSFQIESLRAENKNSKWRRFSLFFHQFV